MLSLVLASASASSPVLSVLPSLIRISSQRYSSSSRSRCSYSTVRFSFSTDSSLKAGTTTETKRLSFRLSGILSFSAPTGTAFLSRFVVILKSFMTIPLCLLLLRFQPAVARHSIACFAVSLFPEFCAALSLRVRHRTAILSRGLQPFVLPGGTEFVYDDLGDSRSTVALTEWVFNLLDLLSP